MRRRRFNSPVLVGNLLRCGTRAEGAPWGLAPAHALARELFFQRKRGAPLASTRSRSTAAHYVTPEVCERGTTLRGLCCVDSVSSSTRPPRRAGSGVRGVTAPPPPPRARRVVRVRVPAMSSF